MKMQNDCIYGLLVVNNGHCQYETTKISWYPERRRERHLFCCLEFQNPPCNSEFYFLKPMHRSLNTSSHPDCAHCQEVVAIEAYMW